MRRLLNLTLLIFAVASLALCARTFGQAQKPAATPNFTGTWKVNIEKSNFGPEAKPHSIVSKNDHREPC
jgi:hypothetical protein